MATRKKPSGQDAVRITTAASSREADIAARQLRYLLSMAVRVVCFIAAVAVGPGWLRWVLVAAAVLLPYVAVVLANATDTRDDTFSLRDAPAQHELPPGAAGPAVPPAQGDTQTPDDTQNGGPSA
ncbi:DUF3099 domain-containing protein [Nocardioides campestrisoli]|uniref:DUF3099 domain-containing protein n=1 Tax=Nocardioides campestrisoli TaxID=2736757 RepID=UPI00163D7A9B|nr:DUF3099 domain-containing protein [Nocardioides campestrisoli]